MGRHEIVLSGYGGQGIVLGGIILAEAAAIFDNINATHNQSYGPEARGGASKSEVIISKEAIHFPEIEHPDILVALTQEAADKFAFTVKNKGVLIVDSSIKVSDEVKSQVRFYSLPIIETAVRIAGSEIVTNMVTLGTLVSITNVVSRDALESAMLSRIPKGTETVNRKALSQGFEIGL